MTTGKRHDRLNQGFVKRWISGSYAASLIVLSLHGQFANKPLSQFLALGMALASGVRYSTQQLVERPLREQLERQGRELAEALQAIGNCKEVLKLNYDNFHQLQTDKQSLEGKIEALEQQLKEGQEEAKRIEIKWREAESANAEWQIEEARWKATLSEYKKPYESEVRKLTEAGKRLQSEYQKTVDELNASLERNSELVAELNYLRLHVQALLAPKKLQEGLDTNNFANQIVDWFAKIQPPILVDAESADVAGQDWALSFRLHSKKDSRRATEYAQAMKIDFSLPQTPSFKINDDRLKITIYRGEKSSESKYLKVDPAWLKEALVFVKNGKTVTHHARFSGSTETGKSTLVSNAVGCLIQNIAKIQIFLADPLKNGQSEWKSLKPKYKGEEECIAGLMEFYEEFQRLDQGLETSTTPKVFILDEFDRMMSKYPELQPIVLDLWKSGRHQHRYLWVLGQSCLVGKFKMNQEDSQNTIGFYLQQAIERGLADANDSPEYNSRLREEWHYCKAKEIRYICLCRPMTVTGRPFLAVMPKPGEYATGEVGAAAKQLEQKQEEERLDYRLLEFDIDSTRANLENLLDQPLSDQPKPQPEKDSSAEKTPKLTAQRKRDILKHHKQGKKVSEIVKLVFGIGCNGSPAYKESKAIVLKIIEESA